MTPAPPRRIAARQRWRHVAASTRLMASRPHMMDDAVTTHLDIEKLEFPHDRDDRSGLQWTANSGRHGPRQAVAQERRNAHGRRYGRQGRSLLEPRHIATLGRAAGRAPGLRRRPARTWMRPGSLQAHGALRHTKPELTPLRRDQRPRRARPEDTNTICATISMIPDCRNRSHAFG